MVLARTQESPQGFRSPIHPSVASQQKMQGKRRIFVFWWMKSREAHPAKRESAALPARGAMRERAARRSGDWKIDRASYVATPVMSDGCDGPPLELRGLFEQFLLEAG
jgi:hypothetical protein